MNNKAYYIFIGVLAAFGLALSWFFFPNFEQISLMEFYDQHYEEAQTNFQKLLEENPNSISVIQPLVWIDLNYANTNKAIDILEKYVNQHPANLKGLEYLGEVYHDTNRPYLFFTNLRRMNALKPSLNNLRVELEFDRSYQEIPYLVEDLQSVVNQYQANEYEYYELSYLYASQGNTEQAITIAKQMLERIPIERVETHIADYVVNLFAYSGLNDEAVDLARRYLTGNMHPHLANALTVLNVLSDQGMNGQSLQLLEALPPEIKNAPDAVNTYAYLLIKGNDSKKMYEVLLDHFLNGTLPENLIETLFENALDHQDFSLLEQIIRKGPPAAIPEYLLVQAIQAAVEANQSAFITFLNAKLPDDYLSQHATARMMLTLAATENNFDELQLLYTFYPVNQLNDAQKGLLANLYDAKREYPFAKHMLESITSLEGFNHDELMRLSDLYLDYHLADKGFELISEVLYEAPTREIELNWALLGAASGKIDEVMQWLKKHSSDERQVLTRLFFEAIDHQQKSLALKIVSELGDDFSSLLKTHVLTLDDEKKRDLVYNLLEIGFKTEASQIFLTLADPKQFHTDQQKREWAYLLIELGFKDKASQLFYQLAHNQPFEGKDMQELLFLWGEKPNPDQMEWIKQRVRLSQQDEKAKWLKYLLDINHPHEAYLLVNKGDLSNPVIAKIYGDILTDQISKLLEAKKTADLKLLIEERLALPGTTDDQKRDMAYLLVDLGDKDEAGRIFLALAEHEFFEGKDVKELLSLWGEKLKPEQLQWVMKKTHDAFGGEKARWLKYLNDLKEYEPVLQLVREDEFFEDGIFDIYVEALIQLKHLCQLEQDLTNVAALEIRPDQLKKMAKIAREHNFNDLALDIYNRLHQQNPEDLFVTKELGLLLFIKGQNSLAEQHLREYLQQTCEVDYRVPYTLGEILRSRENYPVSEYYFLQALTRIHELDKKDLAAAQTEAQINFYLNRTDCALAQYSDLIAQNPTNISLRIGFADILMELKKFSWAYHVLHYEPTQKLEEDEEIEFAIAQLNLMTRRYQFRKALCYASTLLDRYPDSSQVLVAVSILEHTITRWRRAAEFATAASALQPQNENYLRLIDEVIKEYRPFLYDAIEYRMTHSKDFDQLELFQRYMMVSDLYPYTKLGLFYERDDIDVNRYTTLDGEERSFLGSRNRGEVYLHHDFDDSWAGRATVFMGNRVFGGGLDVSLLDLHGRTGVIGNYHQPNWDFINTTIEAGSRDRLLFYRTLRVLPLWEMDGFIAWNRYNLGSHDNLLSTRSGALNISYFFPPWNGMVRFLGSGSSLSIHYLLDAEYQTSIKRYTNAEGFLYEPIPFVNRQQHTLFLFLRKRFLPLFIFEIYGGELVDLASDGPVLPVYGGNLIYEISQDLEVRIEYDHGTSPTEGGVVDRVVANARLRF